MIQVKNVTKKYGESVVLEHADYTFPQRGIICIMGSSGSGKTTLFNLLAGFDSNYDGEIIVGGTAINGMSADMLCAYRRDNVGFIFQDYHLLPGYSALENLMLACDLSDNSRDRCLREATALLSRLGIAENAMQRAKTLSGGQKQRVAIARALLGDPQIIFADEPTGALDRKTSNEIMGLLREISADRLVLVITHDEKVCDFADEVIYISGCKIISEHMPIHVAGDLTPLIVKKPLKSSCFARCAMNFRVHLGRYLAVSLAISIALLAFILSLSFGNIIDSEIAAFQDKNTAFNSGFIMGADDGTVFDYLTADTRIENVYYQYKLLRLSLSLDGKTESIAEKFPASKATESLSYGVMPRRGAHEIALSPSLAKKFAADIQTLIGKELTLTHKNRQHKLTVSGIFNAGYDDFFLSSDTEQTLYSGMSGLKNYSISYDVRAFNDIAAVSDALSLRGIDAKTASGEVSALQNTFSNLNKLFLIISALMLIIGLFICAVLLIRLQNSRAHEIGLLSALGFSARRISSMIITENILLASLASLITLLLLVGASAVAHLFTLPLSVTLIQIIPSVAATFAVVMLLSGIASFKLLRTEPAAALRA
ncbi:MAG: ABC transporter ATP-binding protein/permease [Clostridia bacterium]